jgi:hypothetical protein
MISYIIKNIRGFESKIYMLVDIFLKKLTFVR